MNVMEAIETRGSVRKFLQKPIEQEKLLRIAEAFRLAPSARNTQDWRLIVVQDPDMKERVRLSSPSKAKFLTEAPAILIGTSSHSHIMTNGHRTDSIDVSIAMSFCMLAAWEIGLGTCWMANYKEDEVCGALGLPEGTSVVAIMPVGYPAEPPNAKIRRPIDEILVLKTAFAKNEI